jgi:ABC-type multidrug transport system permease subunit
MNANRRMALTGLLFLVALVLVGVAAALHEVWPLFLVWIPLLTVPWVLTRPE